MKKTTREILPNAEQYIGWRRDNGESVSDKDEKQAHALFDAMNEYDGDTNDPIAMGAWAVVKMMVAYADEWEEKWKIEHGLLPDASLWPLDCDEWKEWRWRQAFLGLYQSKKDENGGERKDR